MGVLIGTSALFKYQGLTFLGASIGMLIWWAILGRASWSWVAARAACQVAGAVLPPALYLAWCARRRQRHGRDRLVQVQFLVRAAPA